MIDLLEKTILDAITSDYICCKNALESATWECRETPLGDSEVVWTLCTPVGEVDVSSGLMRHLREVQTDLFYEHQNDARSADHGARFFLERA